MIDSPSEIMLAQMIIRKKALYLETIGLKKKEKSMYSIIKKEYGLRGNKKSVYTQYCELVEKTKGNI